MNAVSVANKIAEPVLKYTQRTIVRGLQSIASHNQHITSTAGSPSPSAGVMRAWQTLQQDSWFTTQGHIRPQPLDTFNATFPEKSILGSRNLGVFEKDSNSENLQSSIKLLLKGFKFE